ncbi:MAG: metal ABC transporter substrate-binding protein [Actinobacteria bacterium]|nr:metal ABC transporter substrate-binding protein [Actinomycetota bacterium]
MVQSERIVGRGRRRWSGALVLLAIVLSLGLSACGSSSTAKASNGRPKIVATTPLMGDLVKQVGGDAVSVEILIPRGADPHDFEPSASQAARLRDASLIVANGLGLEERLQSTLQSAAKDGATLFEVGPHIDPLNRPGSDRPDPHFWLDPDRMARAAVLVADELARTTNIDRTTLDANAAKYSETARAAGAEAATTLNTVPEGQRLLVTNHDALEYFANCFHYKVIGTIIPGGSTLAEPSASDLRDLVATIKVAGVNAIFSESTSSSKLADTVGRELGKKISIVELSTDTLGEPGSPTSTYQGLITTTAHLIANGLNGR